jgi:cell division transport system permease protein
MNTVPPRRRVAAKTPPKPRPSPLQRWRRRLSRQFRTDFAVDQTTASSTLVAVVAIMTVLAALALAGQRGLAMVTAQWAGQIDGVVTVELPPPSNPAAGSARLRAVLQALAGDRDILSARPIDAARVAALLEPWIGAAAHAPDLPLPELVEVMVRPGARLDAAALEARLSAAAPGARVDDHGALREGLGRIANIALVGAAAVLILIAAAAAGAVIFATRAGIAVHRDAIEILHQMGAAESYIARQFAVHAAAVGALGALIGVMLAVLALLALDRSLPVFTGLANLPDSATLGNLLRFAALPPLAAAVALGTAWHTVMRALRQLM